MATELTLGPHHGAMVTSRAKLPSQSGAGNRLGRVLHGRTLGVFGFGRIGKVVAGYGRAFGMRVLVWSRERGRARRRHKALKSPRARMISTHAPMCSPFTCG